MSKLGNTNKSFKDYLQDPQYEKFFMKPVTSSEVSDMIKSLDEFKSSDPYNIPVKLLMKLIPYNMSVALTDIFNESFKTNIFPDLLNWFTSHVHQFTRAILDWQSHTIGQYLSYPSLNKLCIIECMTS